MIDKRVAIIGAGLVGRAWAVVFARAGWSVRAYDPAEAQRRDLPGQIDAMLQQLADVGLIQDQREIAARISIFDTPGPALDGASFVQESGPERVEAKRAIFAEVDRLAHKDATIASSSSAIVASHFTHDLAGRARCLIGHPVNPPHLAPIVEICGAPWTSAETIAHAKQIYADVGQVPVVIHREIEGFALNRLQAALLEEALRLVADGVISPQDIDHTVKHGLGLRWSFMGPFETIELNAPGGIADYIERYGPAFRAIVADAPQASVWDKPAVDNLLASWGDWTPKKRRARAAWRDARLAALAAHKRAMPAE